LWDDWNREFPDGQMVAVRLLDQTEPDGEARLAVEVHRSSVAGAKATLYLNQTRARS
jgi:hypothetical protein